MTTLFKVAFQLNRLGVTFQFGKSNKLVGPDRNMQEGLR